MSVGASAYMIDDNPVWHTGTRDQWGTSTQKDWFGAFWSTDLTNIHNVSAGNITVGTAKFENGVLISDLNGDGVYEYVVTGADTVYVMGMSGTNPYIIDSFQADGTILSSPQIVGKDGLTTTIVILVQIDATHTEVDFLNYRTADGLKRTYSHDLNDNIFHIETLIKNPSQLYCKTPSQTYVSQNPICAVTGTNPTTNAGEILLFVPGTYNQVGGYYLPSYYQHNLSNGINTFPAFVKETPYGQNPSLFWYNISREDQIVLMDDSELSYPYTDSLYYTDSAMQTVYRLKIASDNLATRSGTVVAFDSTFGGSSGKSVPLQSLPGVLANDVMTQKIIPFDVKGEGQNHVCVERSRNGGTTDNKYYLDIVCFDSTATQHNTSINFTSSNTNRGIISIGRQTIFNNMAGVGGTYPDDYPYPMACQALEMDRDPSSVQTNEQGVYLGCFYYNGSMTANKYTTSLSMYGTTPFVNGNVAIGAYRVLPRFNPFDSNNFNQYMFAGDRIFWQPETTAPQNIGYLTPSSDAGNCAVGNAAYGSNLEMVCVQSGNVLVYSKTLSSPITDPSEEWVNPNFWSHLNTTGTLVGYPKTPCFGQTINFNVIRCDNTTTRCNYNANAGTPVRLVTDCGDGTMTYGAYQANNATVSCTMPNSSQILDIMFWLQSETSQGDYSQVRYAQVSVQPTKCGADYVYDPTPIDNSTTNTTTPTTTIPTVITGNAGDEANDFFVSLMGSGYNPMKLLVGIGLIIAIIMTVMNTDVAKKMQNPTPLVLITAVLATILVTFIGLLPVWILVIIVLLIVLIFVGLRVIFPPSTGN